MRIQSLLALCIASLVSASLSLHTPAASADSSQVSRRALGQPSLKVEPSSTYITGDMPTLRFATFENRDGLPSYSVALTELASGQAVPMGFGYATPPSPYSTSDYEGPYQVETAAQLVVGASYQATMTLRTVSYWGCSIYYSDGCRWIQGGTDTWHWRFTWTGATLDAAVYDPPPPPPAPPAPTAPPAPKTVAAIKLVKHGPYGDDALTYTWQLRRAGEPYKRVRVIGEWGYRNGDWEKHKSFRTDSRGRLSLWLRVGRQRSEPNRYRLVFRGDSRTEPAISEPVRVWYRR